MKDIYLAGGCFWGLEEYFSRIDGVIDVTSGYANGKTETTGYELIGITDHAETVHVVYDESKISLKEIYLYYLRVINPTSVNRQGNDREAASTGREFIILMRQTENWQNPFWRKNRKLLRKKLPWRCSRSGISFLPRSIIRII